MLRAAYLDLDGTLLGRGGSLFHAEEGFGFLRLVDAARGIGNVRVAEGSHGAGVYEAVITTLAERR